MICLDFAVSGLMLKKKQYTYLVAGTKNCISIKVKLDRHWQDLEVFAVCYRDNKEYPYASPTENALSQTWQSLARLVNLSLSC